MTPELIEFLRDLCVLCGFFGPFVWLSNTLPKTTAAPKKYGRKRKATKRRKAKQVVPKTGTTEKAKPWFTPQQHTTAQAIEYDNYRRKRDGIKNGWNNYGIPL